VSFLAINYVARVMMSDVVRIPSLAVVFFLVGSRSNHHSDEPSSRTFRSAS
jgi:hypothetical protein